MYIQCSYICTSLRLPYGFLFSLARSIVVHPDYSSETVPLVEHVESFVDVVEVYVPGDVSIELVLASVHFVHQFWDLRSAVEASLANADKLKGFGVERSAKKGDNLVAETARN